MDNVIYIYVTKKRIKCLGQLPSTKAYFQCGQRHLFSLFNKKNRTASGTLLNSTTGEMNCWRLPLFVFLRLFLWPCVPFFCAPYLISIYKLTDTKHHPQTPNTWWLNLNRHERSIYSTPVTRLTYAFDPVLLELWSGDRGGTVVKVLCYKSEGRWFDSRRCHCYFLLT